MPCFFIVPICVLSVIAGLFLPLSPQLRFLSSYLVLCSIFGLLFSFLLSLAFLVLAARLFGGTPVAWIALLAYLVGIFAGGAVGIVFGFASARALNRRVGLA